MLGDTCTAFCTAYPLLCQDPSNVTLRGNFAAPNGDYYTQVEWSQILQDKHERVSSNNVQTSSGQIWLQKGIRTTIYPAANVLS